jgi:hypothetical protein
LPKFPRTFLTQKLLPTQLTRFATASASYARALFNMDRAEIQTTEKDEKAEKGK